ncbi:AlpA family transcriptional regulator [Neorhizobium sp. T25_13]|uniref:helix-turn-helix transcriptional regulator n=1 Tax=Neorhizobium sp. T25_13 TaxID=2093830 RepID=UPI000CF8A6C7|nr:AlpA family phage regulatory protein [Neorhizobium sp. T25_13]
MVNLLSADDLKAKGIRLSKSQRNVLIKQGSFPPPIKIGGRLVAWSEPEIEAWLRARMAERDGAAR